MSCSSLRKLHLHKLQHLFSAVPALQPAHGLPDTSERAKEKVVDLARLVSAYSGPIKLHVVNFTDIQLYIYEKCPHDELTIIMRRYMMKIAEHFAKKDGCLGLITGESIGQVASQTMQSLAATNAVCTLPVYRPLIGFDKKDIVEISEKINTYETSTQTSQFVQYSALSPDVLQRKLYNNPQMAGLKFHRY